MLIPLVGFIPKCAVIVYSQPIKILHPSRVFQFVLLRQALEKSTNAEEVAMVGRVIWFTCEGENPADIENMGEISYYPYPGVADYYFPYKNQRGYLSPAVFVHLKNPKSKF